MKTLDLPLRWDREQGCLARAEPAQSLMAVLRAMAASESGWAHAPWFGLQAAFARPALQREDQHDLQAALNDALAGMGITWARVASVSLPEAERRPERTRRRFDITLELSGGGVVHDSLNA